MKVLITGGAGFLGSHLGDAFLARGDEVYALDTGSDFKIRHNLLYLIPKPLGMTWNNQMAELMDYDIIDHLDRRKNNLPI